MLHKYFQKGPILTSNCTNIPSTVDGMWIFMAASALAQQKQAGGERSWYSRVGTPWGFTLDQVRFDGTAWIPAYPRSVLWRVFSAIAQPAPGWEPGMLLGRAGALPAEERSFIWWKRLVKVHPLPALSRVWIALSEIHWKWGFPYGTSAGRALPWAEALSHFSRDAALGSTAWDPGLRCFWSYLCPSLHTSLSPSFLST